MADNEIKIDFRFLVYAAIGLLLRFLPRPLQFIALLVVLYLIAQALGLNPMNYVDWVINQVIGVICPYLSCSF